MSLIHVPIYPKKCMIKLGGKKPNVTYMQLMEMGLNGCKFDNPAKNYEGMQGIYGWIGITNGRKFFLYIGETIDLKRRSGEYVVNRSRATDTIGSGTNLKINFLIESFVEYRLWPFDKPRQENSIEFMIFTTEGYTHKERLFLEKSLIEHYDPPWNGWKINPDNE